MHKAAITTRIFIDPISFGGDAKPSSLASFTNISALALLRPWIQRSNSRLAFAHLADHLTRLAEHYYSLRDLKALEEVGLALTSIPLPRANQSGIYYQALVTKRRGSSDQAAFQLEQIASRYPSLYSARATQSLGTIYREWGKYDEALRFQFEALRMATHSGISDLLTMLMARIEIAVIQGTLGNHAGAIANLESLKPLVYVVAKQHPFYLPCYINTLAVELGEVGRIIEARSLLNGALHSAYAPAYPEWRETREELEAKRPPIDPSTIAFSSPVKTLSTSISSVRQTDYGHQIQSERKPAFHHSVKIQTARQITYELALITKFINDLIQHRLHTLFAVHIPLDRIKHSMRSRDRP